MSYLGRKLLKGLRRTKSMWDLSDDEPILKRIWSTLYLSDTLDPIFQVYYSIRSFFSNVKRLIEYSPIVWNHRNFDYGYVLQFQIKLYENLYNGCYVKGHHVFKKKEALKLRTVINLMKRLHADEYDNQYFNYFDEKYGKTNIYFKKIEGSEDKPGGPWSTMHSTREDKMNDKQKALYISERKRFWKLEEILRKQDLELLGKYITKYSKLWWD